MQEMRAGYRLAGFRELIKDDGFEPVLDDGFIMGEG